MELLLLQWHGTETNQENGYIEIILIESLRQTCGIIWILQAIKSMVHGARLNGLWMPLAGDLIYFYFLRRPNWKDKHMGPMPLYS